MDRTRNKIIVILFFLFLVLILFSSLQAVTQKPQATQKPSGTTLTPTVLPTIIATPTPIPIAIPTPTQVPVQQPNFRINGVGGDD